MKQIISFLKLIRYTNLFIILATLVFTRFCLSNNLPLANLFNLKFCCLIIATLMTAAGGNIINDYYDVKLDVVNKPQKVIVGNVISRRWAMMFHLLFSFIAIFFGLLINLKVATFIFLCTILLWLYSVSLKKQFLIGNILVASMSAFVIFILKIFDNNTPTILILLYTIFAFCISFLREIIKDIEDIKGDKRFYCHTIPIVLGIIKTKKIMITFTIFFIAFLVWAILYLQDFFRFQISETENFYKLYLLLFVIIPLTGIIFLIKKATIKKDFSKLSLLTKFIMLSGILSMIFFRL